MPRPPKKWQANRSPSIVEYADFLCRPDGQGAAPLAFIDGERSVPLWALRGIVRGLIPRLRIKNNTGLEDELVALTRIYSDPFLEGVPNRENLLADTVPIHIRKMRARGIHPAWGLKIQADQILGVLEDFPFKSRTTENRVLWLREHLPAVLTDLKASTCCAARCPANTCAELTDPDYQELAKCKTIADLRVHVLAKFHDLSPHYLRKLFSGASRLAKSVSSLR